jgi:hypothetical protein
MNTFDADGGIYTDTCGQEIKVGDYVWYTPSGKRNANNATISLGRVAKFKVTSRRVSVTLTCYKDVYWNKVLSCVSKTNIQIGSFTGHTLLIYDRLIRNDSPTLHPHWKHINATES